MKLLTLWKDRRGVGTIEYALVASLIAVACIGGYQSLGSQLQNTFNDIDQNLSTTL